MNDSENKISNKEELVKSLEVIKDEVCRLMFSGCFDDIKIPCKDALSMIHDILEDFIHLVKKSEDD